MNAFGQQVASWVNAGLAFVYPEACQCCGERRAKLDEGLVCAQCWRQVRFIRAPFCERCGLPFEGNITTKFECTNCKELDLHFTSARSAVAAKGVVQHVIHRYKYHRELWYEPFLVDLLLREALPTLRDQKWDAVVPVPLHPVKQREREFNQAARLASHLARALNLPLNERSLRRTTPTATQTKLSRKARADNMRQAFALRAGVKFRGDRLIVVDDVFTTGATTSACAKALLRGGAGEVCVWTVARGL